MASINLVIIKYSKHFTSWSSSETQGRLVGARGNKSGKEMKRRRFTSKAEKAPGNRLLPDHFQTALSMLPPDWAEKSFVLFCPIGEQQLLRYCGVFLHDGFCISILAWVVQQRSACEGNFHFNFPRYRARNCDQLVANASENWVLATRILRRVASWRLDLSLVFTE